MAKTPRFNCRNGRCAGENPTRGLNHDSIWACTHIITKRPHSPLVLVTLSERSLQSVETRASLATKLRRGLCHREIRAAGVRAAHKSTARRSRARRLTVDKFDCADAARGPGTAQVVIKRGQWDYERRPAVAGLALQPPPSRAEPGRAVLRPGRDLWPP